MLYEEDIELLTPPVDEKEPDEEFKPREENNPKEVTREEFKSKVERSLKLKGKIDRHLHRDFVGLSIEDARSILNEYENYISDFYYIIQKTIYSCKTKSLKEKRQFYIFIMNEEYKNNGHLFTDNEKSIFINLFLDLCEFQKALDIYLTTSDISGIDRNYQRLFLRSYLKKIIMINHKLFLLFPDIMIIVCTIF